MRKNSIVLLGVLFCTLGLQAYEEQYIRGARYAFCVVGLAHPNPSVRSASNTQISMHRNECAAYLSQLLLPQVDKTELAEWVQALGSSVSVEHREWAISQILLQGPGILRELQKALDKAPDPLARKTLEEIIAYLREVKDGWRYPAAQLYFQEYLEPNFSDLLFMSADQDERIRALAIPRFLQLGAGRYGPYANLLKLLLNSPFPETQRSALRAYYRIGAVGADALSILLLLANNRALRWDAIRAIGSLGYVARSARRQLVDYTLTGDPESKRVAQDAIDAIDASTENNTVFMGEAPGKVAQGGQSRGEISRLRALLKDDSLLVVLDALRQVRALGIEGRELAPEVWEVVKLNSNSYKEAAAECLAAMGPDVILPLFDKNIKDTETSAQSDACRVLEYLVKDMKLRKTASEDWLQREIVARVLPVFRANSPYLRTCACKIFNAVGPVPWVRALMPECWADLTGPRNSNTDVKREIAKLLGSMGEAAAPKLMELIQQPDTAEFALIGFQSMKPLPPIPVEVFTKILAKHEEEMDAPLTNAALGMLSLAGADAKSAWPVVWGKLKTEQEKTQIAVLQTLGAIGTPAEYAAVLVNLIDRREAFIPKDAIKMLGECLVPNVDPVLLKVLKAKEYSWDCKLAAIEAFAERGDSSPEVLAASKKVIEAYEAENSAKLEESNTMSYFRNLKYVQDRLRVLSLMRNRFSANTLK